MRILLRFCTLACAIALITITEAAPPSAATTAPLNSAITGSTQPGVKAGDTDSAVRASGEPQVKVSLELAKMLAKSIEPDHLGDLIKIGLPIVGAIIAAIIGMRAATRTAETQRQTTLDAAREGHRAEFAKEYGNRLSARFDSLVASIDVFYERFSAYITAVMNAIETKPEEGYTTEKLIEIKKCESECYGAFLDLGKAESKLLIVGEATLHGEFRSFAETAREMYRDIRIGDESLKVPEIEKRILAFREMRRDLLLKLGNAEKAWWQKS